MSSGSGCCRSTGLTAAELSGVADAFSFPRMSTPATEHGQLDWKDNAFPVSFDGLELVASLHILAEHRAGRGAGVLPCVALGVRTAASLTAHIVVGGDEPVGRPWRTGRLSHPWCRSTPAGQGRCGVPPSGTQSRGVVAFGD